MGCSGVGIAYVVVWAFLLSSVVAIAQSLPYFGREKGESMAVVLSERDKVKEELLSMKQSATHKDGKMTRMNKQLEKLQERVESVERSFVYVNQ